MTRPRLTRSLLAEIADTLRGTSDELFSLVQSGLIPQGLQGWKVVEALDEHHDLAQCGECAMWLDVAEIVDGTCEACIWELAQ